MRVMYVTGRHTPGRASAAIEGPDPPIGEGIESAPRGTAVENVERGPSLQVWFNEGPCERRFCGDRTGG